MFSTFAAATIEDHVSYFTQAPSGTLADDESVVRGLKIFRAGSFRDSMGRKRTYTTDDLDKMVEHFNLLRDKGILPNVPVRADHSASINSVVGYFESVRRDGEYLLGDIEFTEPDALAKYRRKTYRGRSLEVASYRTNDEDIYTPVVFGLAFVDIPAVEGLYRHQGGTPTPIKENDPVTTENKPPEPVTFVINKVPTQDYAAVQSYIADLEAKVAEGPGEPTLATFRVAGADTTDYGKVQAHIEALENFQKEAIDSGRKDFVKALASDNKIAATQIDGLTSFALGLTDEQFVEFKKSYDGAAAPAIFGQHGGQGGPPAPTATGGAQDEKAVLEQTVEQFRFAGWSEERIAETDAFKRLAALKA